MNRRAVWPATAACLLTLDAALAYTGNRDDSLCNTARDNGADTKAGAAALALLLGALWVHIVYRVPVPGADALATRIGVKR